jgi:seryl-tRNA synthetase
MEQERPEIDWSALSYALTCYKNRGFTYIEVPWLVPKEITEITHNEIMSYRTDMGDLVGSAEQSFLSLDLDGKLLPGKYVTLTPCFRDDIIDETHQQTFMKVELYQNIDVTDDSLEKIIFLCQNIFESLLNHKVSVEKTEIGYDILYKNIELGSYGIRKYNEMEWIYATGIAEPRFSVARKM